MLLTHSVVTLLRKATGQLSTLTESLEAGRELDLHYVPSRYPNGLPGGYLHRFYGKETAGKAIAARAGILAVVEQFYRDEQVEWGEDE